MRNLICLVIVILVVSVCNVFGGTYSGGAGTAEYPYLISDSNDLIEISGNSDDWEDYFILTADIDMDPNLPGREVYTTALIAPNLWGYDHYYQGMYFSGTFDGGGHRILNFTVHASDENPNYVGLFGAISQGTVKNLGLVNVTILSNSDAYGAGGIAAQIYGGVIRECYVTGNVDGGVWTGGMVGNCAGSTILDSYTNCSVSGYVTVGGFLGAIENGTVRNCFSAGEVSGDRVTGGFVSSVYRDTIIEGCLWDIEISGITESPYAFGLVTSEMQSAITYTLHGWSGEVWSIDEGNGYPQLLWDNAGGTPIPAAELLLAGSGSIEEPFLIYESSELELLGKGSFFLDKHFSLMNDIDATGAVISPIGTSNMDVFCGTFKGNGYIIDNLTLDFPSSSYTGLFGYTRYDCEITDLGLRNVSVHGGLCTGGLAGFNDGLISGCFVTGDIHGTDNTGGLAGSNDGTIKDSYSRCTVNGGENVGGLVGSNSLTLERCYSSSQCVGEEYVGGLAGRRGSYNFVTDCFWDVDVSGLTYSASGRGFARSHMQSKYTYIFNGWADQCWKIDDGVDYPRLTWEDAAGDYITEEAVPLAGEGTMENPYLIGNSADLALVTIGKVLWGNHYQMTSDIDLGDSSVYPIGWEELPFTGSFDGMDHVVSNMTLEFPEKNEVGLFGYVTVSGRLSNIHLTNVNVTGNYRTGGLAAVCEGEVINCTVTGSISSHDDRCGGLIGESSGRTTGCGADVIVFGHDYTGGLIGMNYGPLSRCWAKSHVEGSGWTGGLTGSNGDSISKCFSNTSFVKGGGRLVGAGRGHISQCYCIGTVEAGSVDTMIGTFTGTMEECFTSVGSLIYSNDEDKGQVIRSFYDIDVTEGVAGAAGRGYSTEMMKGKDLYSLNVWDPNAWTIDEGQDYPRLSWENIPGVLLGEPEPNLEGSGTNDEPYEIESVEDFERVMIESYYWDKHLIVKRDLDLSGLILTPIGTDYDWAFTGTFDGNGHTYYNATIDIGVGGRYRGGFFGYVSGKAEIKDFNLENVYVYGYKYVGGLIGVMASGNVSYCSTSGTVNGPKGAVGGLAGSCWSGATISRCSSSCSVLGTTSKWSNRDKCGGLIGSNGGTVELSYATGDVAGYRYIGGLIGGSGGSLVRRCYATGSCTGRLYVGGLIGRVSDSMISECFASGRIEGVERTGGLLGYCGDNFANDDASQVINCYATGDVYGDDYSGALIGDAEQIFVSSCYCTGDVSGTRYVNGMIGSPTYVDTSGAGESFWSGSCGGWASAFGKEISNVTMRTVTTFVDAGWDIVGEGGNGEDEIWIVSDGDYPRLAWESVLGDFLSPRGVGIEDYAVFADAWRSRLGDLKWNDKCDLVGDADEVIDLYDLSVFVENWQGDVFEPQDFSLKGHWDFDEGTGEVCADRSVFRRNGTLLNMNDAAWGEGKSGGGLTFDGVDDEVIVFGYSGVKYTDSRTVCAWVKTTDTEGEIVSWGWNDKAGKRLVFGVEDTGCIRVDVGGGFVAGSTSVCDGQWHHVAAVLDSDGSPDVSDVMLYVDGLLDPVGNCEAMEINTDIYSGRTRGLTIGAWEPFGSYFEGVIDEVRIYDRALSEIEIGVLAE